MSEASGTDMIDAVAAHNGTYTGVTLGQPGIGDGLTCPLFDGANDYAIANHADFEGLTAFTFGGWFRPDSFPATNPYLISLPAQSGWSGDYIRFSASIYLNNLAGVAR